MSNDLKCEGKNEIESKDGEIEERNAEGSKLPKVGAFDVSQKSEHQNTDQFLQKSESVGSERRANDVSESSERDHTGAIMDIGMMWHQSNG